MAVYKGSKYSEKVRVNLSEFGIVNVLLQEWNFLV